jgi:hypothetical protein
MANNRVLVSETCTDGEGRPLGTFLSADHALGQVETAGVLSYSQIRKKHDLTTKEFQKLQDQVLGTKVRDCLFSWPDGPRYDILMYLVARCG